MILSRRPGAYSKGISRHDLPNVARPQRSDDIQRRIRGQEMDRSVHKHRVGATRVKGIDLAEVQAVDGARAVWLRREQRIEADVLNCVADVGPIAISW